MMRPRGQSGFNLLETLVASLILSGTVVTVGALNTRALRGLSDHRSTQTAVDLADRQLRLIDYLGIDRFLEQGQTEGVFEEPAPGYQWTVDTEALEVGWLYRVTLTMTWVDQGRPRQLSLTTRLNGTGSVIAPEEEGVTGEGGGR